MRGPGIEHLSKAEWRTRLIQARREVPAERHAADAVALTAAAATLDAATVCAYLPFGTEPGTPELPDALVRAGARVLLPVIPDVPGPLEWAEYTGIDTLVPGRLRGVREPSGPRLGVAAVATADVVLVPALAVDHRGVRLGRGAGFYDRSLGLAGGVRLLAVIRDDELVPRLPGEPHDVRMDGVLTPGHGVLPLPR